MAAPIRCVERAAYLIHSRIASQARPSRPACAHRLRARSAALRQSAAPAPVVTFSTPTRWPAVSGATSGSVRSMLRLQPGAFAFGHRDEYGTTFGAQPDLCGLAFPDRHGDDRLALGEQAHRIECLEAPVQQLLAFVGARLHRAGIEDHAEQAPLARALAGRPRDSEIRARRWRSGNSRRLRYNRSSCRRRSDRAAAAGCGSAARCCCTCIP